MFKLRPVNYLTVENYIDGFINMLLPSSIQGLQST